MNREYYNEIVNWLSPIHAYLWGQYNSSLTEVGQVIYLGALSLFTPSQISINIILFSIIFIRLLYKKKWMRFAWITFMTRLICLLGIGGVLQSEYGLTFQAQWIGVIGTLTIVFYMIGISFKNGLYKHFELLAIITIVSLSLYQDPMQVGLSHLIGASEVPLVGLLSILIYSIILAIPILLFMILIFAFHIDELIFQSKRMKQVIFLTFILILILLSIHEVTLYGFVF